MMQMITATVIINNCNSKNINGIKNHTDSTGDLHCHIPNE